MGKTPKRNLRCRICKSSFPSYQEKSKAGVDKQSHANHRSRNKRCKEVQERLKKQHLENGNYYDLDFDNDEEMGFDVVEEVDENDTDSQRGRAGTVVSENEDVDEDHADDNVSVHGSEDLADSYEEEKRQEDLEYQEREHEEEENEREGK